jgi:hypothetical protein
MLSSFVQTCQKRRRATFVLKLDFAKAFDTVNWEGLQNVLRARGFQQRWIQWMLKLLGTSKSAVLVNGTPGPWINWRAEARRPALPIPFPSGGRNSAMNDHCSSIDKTPDR